MGRKSYVPGKQFQLGRGASEGLLDAAKACILLGATAVIDQALHLRRLVRIGIEARQPFEKSSFARPMEYSMHCRKEAQHPTCGRSPRAPHLHRSMWCARTEILGRGHAAGSSSDIDFC